MIIEIYRDKSKEYRWRAKSKGRILADSGEGYTRRAGCVAGVKSLAKQLAKRGAETQIVDLTEMG